MSTRPDVQEKRDKTYRLKRGAAMAMHAIASGHEGRAASLGHQIAILQAEQISAMIAAALLRKQAREEGAP